MKIYISADIEGVTGTTAWDEANKTHPDYGQFQTQMTQEVKAACEGAMEAGADEIVVKDAHASGRNITAAELPECVKLVRGWSRHPYMMMQELNGTFDAALMIGYHARAGSTQNPLAHTMNSSKFAWIQINGMEVSEFLLNAYTASLEQVPLVFISGDQGVCAEAQERIPLIQTVPVKTGAGDSTINIHPKLACDTIRRGVRESLGSINPACCAELPAHFAVTIQFNDFKEAYRAAFFPGASDMGTGRISFSAAGYLDVLKLMLFI